MYQDLINDMTYLFPYKEHNQQSLIKLFICPEHAFYYPVISAVTHENYTTVNA